MGSGSAQASNQRWDYSGNAKKISILPNAVNQEPNFKFVTHEPAGSSIYSNQYTFFILKHFYIFLYGPSNGVASNIYQYYC